MEKLYLIKNKKNREFVFEVEEDDIQSLDKPYLLYTRSKAEDIIAAHNTRMEPRYRDNYPHETPMDLEIIGVHIDTEGD